MVPHALCMAYGSYPDAGRMELILSKMTSLHLMSATVGLNEVTLTIRAPLAARSLGMMRLVKRKCPMWLVANCISMPPGLRARSGRSITAALLMRMSMIGMEVQERNEGAAEQTAFWLDRLSWRA